MADRKLGFLVEEVCPCHVDGDLDDFFLGILNRGGHADDNLLVGDEDVEVGLSAEQLAEVDLGGDAVARGELVEGEEVLGTHAEDDGLADIGLESSLLGFGISSLSLLRMAISLPPSSAILTSRKFIWGEPMKPATKRLHGESYSTFGVSNCWMMPSFMTTMRSPMVIASVWS